MSQHKIHRNDPCPCGSGKKYKKCCMKDEITDPRAGENPEPTANDEETRMKNIYDAIVVPPEFYKLLEKKLIRAASSNFKEVEEKTMQFAEEFSGQPSSHFLGLTPNTMETIMSNMVSENEELLSLLTDKVAKEAFLETPLMEAVISILNHLKEKGEVPGEEDQFLPDELICCLPGDYSPDPDTWTITELNWIELLKLLLQVTGLMKLRDGAYRLSRKGRVLLEAGAYDEIYKELFYAYAEEFDWCSYYNLTPEAGLIQDALIYLLYILKEKAAEFVVYPALVEIFVTNFRPVAKAFKELPAFKKDLDPEVFLALLFGEQFVYGFCTHMGLLEIREDDEKATMKNGLTGEKVFIPMARTTRLFKKVLRWGI